MSIIQSDTDPKNVEAIIENIKELNGDEKELLWDWIQSKTLVGGQLTDVPEEKFDNANKCKDCSRKIEFGNQCDRCQTGNQYA